MRKLDGKELAGYITERQARQVRRLRQAYKIFPKLAIVTTSPNKVTDLYIRLKQEYGADILVDVDIYRINQSEVRDLIKTLNSDDSVHGIVVQLPISKPEETDEIVDLIQQEKDVDGLGRAASYGSATALAINWLLAGYNVDLKGKRIAVVGLGKLVGKPLYDSWKKDGLDVYGYDDTVSDLGAELKKADLIVSATGVPGLVNSSMVKPGAVIVDAGTASDNGKVVGDVAGDVRLRDDVMITPEKGGVGPLTVVALFDNLIQAAELTAPEHL